MRRKEVTDKGANCNGKERDIKNKAFNLNADFRKKPSRRLLFTFACACALFLSTKTFFIQYQNKPQTDCSEPQTDFIKPQTDFIKPQNISYIICNGLSNQLLGHAGGISKAIMYRHTVHIPDVFIFNGKQSSDENVLPTTTNSVPLSQILDVDVLLKFIEHHGIKATMIPFGTAIAEIESKPWSCNWQETMKSSNHQLALLVLRSFKPSPFFSKLMQEGISKVPGNWTNGICLHHRNGLDWREHCKRWEGITDGIWRKNCLNDRDKPIHHLVQNRIPFVKKKSWIYYIGDENPSHDLVQDFKSLDIDIVHRKSDKLLFDHDIAKAVNLKEISLDTHRDVFAAIDYFICAEIESFIGNSVSRFSATQIAIRNGMKSSWYNSRSIPLASSFTVFQIPVVYTYTEASQTVSKNLLKVSILSVRKRFGYKIDIHVLYHGSKDKEFLTWLRTRKVIVHDHNPTWIDTIEEMRLNGDPKKSHLFLDKGSYIGTWQRIDIPLFIDAEYIMFMDSDTVVHRWFGIHDFGLDITPSIACSAEAYETSTRPLNLGVSLFNVPMLRETYDDFMKFIKSHRNNPIFEHENISDQGAYLEYYSATVQFLDTTFNVKPYWNGNFVFAARKIVHFHALKPHDILKALAGYPKDSFPTAFYGVYDLIMGQQHHACLALHDFGVSISTDLSLLNEYCSSAGGSVEAVTSTCNDLFLQLADNEKGSLNMSKTPSTCNETFKSA